MAKDIKVLFNSDTQEGDVVLDNGDLERDEGLSTAVMISLFTDRRAEDSDNYDNNDKRGWWGDLISGEKIGSRLYLLNRSKSISKTEIKAKEYIYEALEWLIEDGIAMKININTWTFGDAWNRRLGALIEIYRTDGNNIAIKFDDLWSNTPVIGVA